MCLHHTKYMFARRWLTCSHGMRPAHGTRLPTGTAPISCRLLCSHGLRLAHGTRLPTLRKRSRSPPCSHTVCLAHGHLPTCMFNCSVIGFFCDSFQITKCHVMSHATCPDWGDMQWQSHAVNCSRTI